MEEMVVKIRDNEYIAKADPQHFNKITMNGKEYTIEQLKSYGKNVFSLSINNKLYMVQMDRLEDGSYRILHNNFAYNAEVKTTMTKLLEKFMKSKGGSGKANNIPAPMPGLVVKINVEVGQEIKKGDKLVIVEAMKMENALTSPRDGKIKVIKAKEGEPVEKGMILIELESLAEAE